MKHRGGAEMERLQHVSASPLRTRAEAYYKIRFSRKVRTSKAQIFYALMSHGPLSDADIVIRCGWSKTNSAGIVAARRGELVDDGLVESVDERQDPRTKMNVTRWRIVADPFAARPLPAVVTKITAAQKKQAAIDLEEMIEWIRDYSKRPDWEPNDEIQLLLRWLKK